MSRIPTVVTSMLCPNASQQAVPAPSHAKIRPPAIPPVPVIREESRRHACYMRFVVCLQIINCSFICPLSKDKGQHALLALDRDVAAKGQDSGPVMTGGTSSRRPEANASLTGVIWP